MNLEIKTMRDVIIEEIYNHMLKNEKIFFLSADFGAPALDKLKEKFKRRFINVGIAEQNLINLSTGLALEGFTVYAYAIVPFLTMRAYEQIRINLCLLGQLKKMNINLIGVGAGLSYDVSGPTHQCLEDISITRTLPNLMVFSPSDWVTAKEFVDYSLKKIGPKYLRLDAKPLPQIYKNSRDIIIKDGIKEVKKGKDICLVSTGIMTHKAIGVAKRLVDKGVKVGIIDVFLLKPFNKTLFFKLLNGYKYVVTLEEGFVGKAGLDNLVLDLINEKGLKIIVRSFGFSDIYAFNVGSRDYLHRLAGLDEQSIFLDILRMLE